MKDLTKATESVITTAKQAGEIVKKYFYSGEFTSHSKGGVDFATQADLEVDAFLVAHLQKQFPKARFLTEETAPKDYSLLKDAEDLFVIDPIDGTMNFSRGDEYCAISIALVEKGTPVLGVLYLPMENKLYYTNDEMDDVLLNEKKVTISSVNKIDTALVASDWPWDVAKRQQIVAWLAGVMQSVRLNKIMGSAASALANVASGNLDAYFHISANPWDYAAGALFVQKVGGRITRTDGSEWNIFHPDILATNGVLHEQMLVLLNNK